MCDIEQAIADWRRHMLAAGITTPVPLEELEIHLREEIERQLKSGRTGQQALEIAIERIGQPQALKGEFQRAGALPKRSSKYIWAVSGILLVNGLRQLWSLATVHSPVVAEPSSMWCFRVEALLTVATAILFFCRPRNYWIAAFVFVGWRVFTATMLLVFCYPSVTIGYKLRATVPPFALALFTLFCLVRARMLDLAATRNTAPVLATEP